METLLYIALWGAAIFLMMRFGCGAHMMGHGGSHKSDEPAEEAEEKSRSDLRWVAPPTGKDPVCGQAVATATAKSSVFDGQVYYLCSRECREAFEKAPKTYVGGAAERSASQLEHSHG